MATARNIARTDNRRGEIADLKRLAAGIIRVQGNRFIKELLNEKDIRIGVNKDDFERNLTAAIEDGTLGRSEIETWLNAVEGWGNQHVYLYNLRQVMRQDLTMPKVSQRVRRHAELQAVWNGDTLLEFPDERKLTSISFANSTLRVVWQESSPSWTPVPSKNYTAVEGLDTYEYRAWRKVEKRALTRFVANAGLGLAALFVPRSMLEKEHQNVIVEAKRVVGLLMDLAALQKNQIDISSVSRNLDQANVPSSSTPMPGIKAQRSRLASGGAYVEFAASGTDKAYWEEPAIQNVRKSVKAAQLSAFQGSDGVFMFQPGSAGLERPLRIQLVGSDQRIVLGAQMDSAEVWGVLVKLSEHQ